MSAIKDSEELRSIRARFDVHAVRITTVSTPSVRWAVAHIEPKPGFQLDGATVIVGRFYRAWKVIDVGTGGAGCWLPKRVVRDLRLGGCTADDDAAGASWRARWWVARERWAFRGQRLRATH